MARDDWRIENSYPRDYGDTPAGHLYQMHRPRLVQVHPRWLVQLRHRGLRRSIQVRARPVLTSARRGW